MHPVLLKHAACALHLSCMRIDRPSCLQSRKDEFDLDDDPEAAAEAAERDEGAAAGGKFSWSNTDREYTYDELLGECC